MSVKSFLSKLKWNSKIAEGDDNMFIELKPATPFVPGCISQMVYMQKLWFTLRQMPYRVSIITHSHRPVCAQTHGTTSIHPRRDISSMIRSMGANRRGRWMSDKGWCTHTHTHADTVDMVGIPQQVSSLSWHVVQGLRNSLPPPWGLTEATVNFSWNLPLTNYSVSLSASIPTPSCSTYSLAFSRGNFTLMIQETTHISH